MENARAGSAFRIRCPGKALRLLTHRKNFDERIPRHQKVAGVIRSMVEQK